MASTLTDNEIIALQAIVSSEYQDGRDRASVVDHAVWTSYCNPFASRRTFSGVIASLSKKGLVVCGGSSADANHAAGCDGTTLAITAAGFDALCGGSKALISTPLTAKRTDNFHAVIFGADGMLVAKMAGHEQAFERAESVAVAVNNHAALLAFVARVAALESEPGMITTGHPLVAAVEEAKAILLAGVR